MSNYEYVELRVAYPGHPVVKLIDGADDVGLVGVKTVAEPFFHGRVGIGTDRQEVVYRLPAEVDMVWEVTERVNNQKVRRWVATHDGKLYRLTYGATLAVMRKSMSLTQAVEMCQQLPVGPDYR
jgi:hypothetical protein